MKVVFDTNILIDYLNGVSPAKKEIQSYESPVISIITWMEVLIGADSKEQELTIKGFLSKFSVNYIDQEIAELAVILRKDHKLKLPDAIIWATAKKNQCLLITRNFSSYAKNDSSIRVPY